MLAVVRTKRKPIEREKERGEIGERDRANTLQEELMAYIKKHKEFVICVLIGLIIILGMWASGTSTFRILKNIEKMAKEREENGRNMFLERFHRSPRYYDLEEAAMVNGAKFPVYIHQAGKSPQRVETPMELQQSLHSAPPPPPPPPPPPQIIVTKAE